MQGQERPIPSENEIKMKLQLIQPSNVEIQNQKARLTKIGMGMDMGGIAKGYALDLAYSIAEQKNKSCGLMNLGRQLMILGQCKEKTNIGILNPKDAESTIATVELKSGSISTSASYERFFIHQGKKYGHILNPITGFPVSNDVASVTVWSQNGIDADVWSTALFVAGYQEGIKLLKSKNQELGVLWIFHDGQIAYQNSKLGMVVQ